MAEGMGAEGVGVGGEGSSQFLLMKATTKCIYGGNGYAQREKKVRNR